MAFSFLYIAIWALLRSIILIAATPLESSRIVYAPAGRSQSDVVHSIRQELGRAAFTKRDTEWKNSTSLDRSWDGAVLLQLSQGGSVPGPGGIPIASTAGITVVCTKCYLKGFATGELSVPSNFSMLSTIESVKNSTVDMIESLTDRVGEYVDNIAQEFWTDVITFDWDDFELPTLDFDFDNYTIEEVGDVNVRFSFDGLELYMELDTTLALGSTYTLPLYNSITPLGITISENLKLGLTFSVSLILDAQFTIDISSGIHLKLDDGFAVDIALFGDKASGITFNGGQFEFLPVTVESGGFTFKATLRLEIRLGMEEHTKQNLIIPSVGGGIGFSVFADIAELTTEVTNEENNTDCALAVAQSFQVALGAAAGATVHISTDTWGPRATTSIPIWYTELASGCALAKTTSTTPAPTMPSNDSVTVMAKRQDMSTTTTALRVIYTGINCLSAGLINCPASLQNTTQQTSTTTLTTTVSSGASFKWATATNTQMSVASTVAFGSNAARFPSITGSPTSWVPPPPSSTSTKSSGTIEDSINDIFHGKNGERNTIIALSVGLGVPLLFALCALGTIAGLICMRNRRKKYNAVSQKAEQ